MMKKWWMKCRKRKKKEKKNRLDGRKWERKIEEWMTNESDRQQHIGGGYYLNWWRAFSNSTVGVWIFVYTQHIATNNKYNGMLYNIEAHASDIIINMRCFFAIKRVCVRVRAFVLAVHYLSTATPKQPVRANEKYKKEEEEEKENSTKTVWNNMNLARVRKNEWQ